MPKDPRFYFSHDYNARNDRKIASLVKDFKSSGYGIYWCTAEMMHEEGGHLDFDEITINAIAKDLNEANEAVLQVLQKCIDVYKLFVLHENQISAGRVKQNLSEREAKKEVRKEAGRKGGINSGKSRSSKIQSKQNEAMLQNDEANLKKNEANEPKERKVKESKGKDIEEEIERKEGVAPLPPPNSVNGYQYLPDGRSYIERTVFFTALDFEDLPDDKNEAARDLILATKKAEVSPDEMCSLWKSFKTLNLTFQKPYRNKDDVYNHFANWAKSQPFGRGAKKPTAKVKGKYQSDVNEALANYKPLEYEK